MKYLSRNDLETIGGRVIEAYKRLPAISGQALERVDIDFLCQELLGLRIDYARLSLNGEKIGLTSSCDIGVEVFPEDPSSTEEQYYMLDGKTILIESDLMKEGANIGRRFPRELSPYSENAVSARLRSPSKRAFHSLLLQKQQRKWRLGGMAS